jgi:hypothetical protein
VPDSPKAENEASVDDGPSEGVARRGHIRKRGGRSGGSVRPSVRSPKHTGSADSGADLERRVGRVEFAEGALVRLRVPVRVEADAGRAILTDIDVLALDLDFRLRLSTSVLECKSGKGQSGEPDRLFWLSGLQRYLTADRAVLVRQTISRRGRIVATRLGVEVQDVATLSMRESAHAWLPERFAHVGGEACLSAETRTDTQLKALGHIPTDLVAFIRYDSLLASPNAVLSALMSLGEAIKGGNSLPDPTRIIRQVMP